MSEIMRRKIPFWASVFTMLSVVVLCNLGVWQLQRLTWKENLISKLNAQVNEGIVHVNAAQLSDDFLYRLIEIKGEFIDENLISIIPRLRKHSDGTMMQGKHIYAALKVGSDELIMVNLGWVPQDYNVTGLVLPKGEATVEGYVRPFPKGNYFTPKNDVLAAQWYLPHRGDFAVLYGRKIINNIIYAADMSGDGVDVYPQRLNNDFELTNNHAQYAVFWFSMALILPVIFYLRFFRRPI
ncbi:MAG: SURF1 family protein [Micavibrio sp.]|nr:SURF1 family protein [Micavibrio sp.]